MAGYGELGTYLRGVGILGDWELTWGELVLGWELIWGVGTYFAGVGAHFEEKGTHFRTVRFYSGVVGIHLGEWELI